MIDTSNGKVEIMSGIANALDIDPLIVDRPVVANRDELPVVPDAAMTVQQQQAENDFNESRATLKALIDQGMSSLSTAILIAQTSEKASAYQHVAQLIKEINDANQNLLALHQARRDLTPQTQHDDDQQLAAGGTVNHNNVIVVSNPNDLLTMVKGALSHRDDAIEPRDD